MKHWSSIAVLLFFAGSFLPVRSQDIPDTLQIVHKPVQQQIRWHYRYDQTLVMKLMLSQALFDGRYKRKDNGKSEVFLDFAETLEVIKRMDRLTLGMPKIIYLTGWQYNGHDSKYPAWFEVNPRLKRQQDPDALTSLKWLMHEAGKYHTTVSIHINMFDAYEDSPLWDEYVQKDIIAKHKNGTILKGEWGSPVSYTREWELGLAQQRIDRLCRMLPLQKAGTIHIDAFHTSPPLPETDADGKTRINLDLKPISPYLSFTVADEAETQKKLFRYWAGKGIDVTSEGVDFLRPMSFEGYQPMAWWVGRGVSFYTDWPSSLYTGGVDRSEWGRLFGTSMHGEDIVRKDKTRLAGFKEDFCTRTLVWYYLNRLQRQKLIRSNAKKEVQFSGGVRTVLEQDRFRLTKNGNTLVDNGDVLLPALWTGKNIWIAYSRDGYQRREWALPPGFSNSGAVKVYSVLADGKEKEPPVPVRSGKLVLSLKKDQMLVLAPL
ncbi:endo-alpha-N-acetylgalactosaminidase family protein [Niabella sp. CC-SYL272]|uniref:endo-alpha-N-acetylgalactosaminidase family protein n=1 Tax=Niabella agricola TaxID=2891571 RepID=UPI001F20A6EB|nr:endo-alpha-N-acetylgalactosaminidase family protein [Niabella agricola]MCF3107360.1 endo-alpha-N-acetylgalactosaminidase family protein [Niabella agricola]